MVHCCKNLTKNKIFTDKTDTMFYSHYMKFKKNLGKNLVGTLQISTSNNFGKLV